MALILPINAPLTDSQAELTAKIGSMKSLLALPFNKRRNVPKDKQISTFDYLLRILAAMGITPEFLFLIFIDKVFSSSSNFLSDTISKSLGASLAAKGKDLQTDTTINNPSEAQVKSLTKTNTSVIKSRVDAVFTGPVGTITKDAIAKKLTVMIFGPKDGPAVEKLVPDAAERERLIDEAICAEQLFTVSNKPVVREEDVEFNKVRLRQQLEKGEVIFEISCQDVKIKLPEDPVFIFPPQEIGEINSNPINPAQNLNFLIQHVNSQTQNINNEANANAAGKGFSQIMTEKLISYISTLVFPYVGAILAEFLPQKTSTKDMQISDIAPSSCSIVNDPSNEDKKVFASSMSNLLLKALLTIILLFVIKKFKTLVTNYFARTAQERAKRRADKVKLRFSLFKDVGAAADKAAKYAAASAAIQPLISEG